MVTKRLLVGREGIKLTSANPEGNVYKKYLEAGYRHVGDIAGYDTCVIQLPNRKPLSRKAIMRIESETDYEVMEDNNFEIKVINRCVSDASLDTINIENKTIDQIIDEIEMI